MKKFHVVFSPKAEFAPAVEADVSVEAEYGAVVVEGGVLTLAHHQRSGQYSSENSPAPCNAWVRIGNAADILARRLAERGQVRFLVSHLDLDTVGGVLRTMAVVDGTGRDLFHRQSFWTLAEFVDLNGAHKLGLSGAEAEDIRALRAWWSWFRGLKRLGQDDNTDVTDIVDQCREALFRILVDENQKMMEDGDRMAEDEAKLNASSFVEAGDGVIVRVSDAFANHLYVAPGASEPSRAVVALSTTTGSVTVSLADPVPGVSCRDIVQGLWGPEAGGHAGIAGSPRGKRMSLRDLVAARDALASAITGNS